VYFESKGIPAELRNPRGLKKMQALYREQVRKHGKGCPQMVKLQTDIQTLKRELALLDEPLFALPAAR
jgi:hypothetical protein